MKALSPLILLCCAFSVSTSRASTLIDGPCLSSSQQIATDHRAQELAQTRAALTDRYAQVTSSPGNKCIHFVEAKGSGARPLIVLIHGVPESWYAWRKMIDPLVDAGYDLLIPDLPGMGQSSRPASLDGLALPTLASDIRELIHLSGRQKAIVIGHDIGGTVAWSVAMYAPEAVDRLVIVSAPHPGIWRSALVDSPDQEQITKSAYAYDFAFHGDFFAWLTTSVPAKIDLGYRAAQLDLIFQAFHNPTKGGPKHAGAISAKDISVYAGELSRDQEALWITRYYTQIVAKTMKVSESAVGGRSDFWWANAAIKPLQKWFEAKNGISPVDADITASTPVPQFPDVQVPTLLFFDQHDPYNSDVYVDAARLQQAGVTNVRIVRPTDSSHWIPEDVPEELFAAIRVFLGQP